MFVKMITPTGTVMHRVPKADVEMYKKEGWKLLEETVVEEQQELDLNIDEENEQWQE